jgi:hypothetical protein
MNPQVWELYGSRLTVISLEEDLQRSPYLLLLQQHLTAGKVMHFTVLLEPAGIKKPSGMDSVFP